MSSPPSPNDPPNERIDRDQLVGSVETEGGAAERLTFFSDAVSAIALTLLAIDLPVPQGKTSAEFWASVHDNRPEYAAFVISFVVISAHWATHHRIFRFIARVDDRLRLYNMFWLFGVVCIPFVTRMIDLRAGWAPGSSNPSRFAIYSCVQLLCNVMVAVMLRHAAKRNELRPDTPRSLISLSYWHSATFAGGFLISIPFFFIWHLAWILWFAVPVVMGVVGREEFNRRAKLA